MEASDVTKSFGGVAALSECSVVLKGGDVTGLVGSNGAGKSTLVNVLAGLYKPDQGNIRFQGKDLRGVPTEGLVALGIVKTFQAARIFESLSTLNNLLVAGRGRSDSSLMRAILGRRDTALENAVLERAHEVLELLGLSRLSDVAAGKLSGGQKKLLGLGRALMLDPKVLLLDEPLAGVTPSLFGVVERVIARLAEQGVAIGIVEHHIAFIEAVCNSAYALANGKVIAQGDTRSVLSHPLVVQSLLQ